MPGVCNGVVLVAKNASEEASFDGEKGAIYIKFEEFSLNFEVICSFNLVTIVTFIYDMGIRRINIELLTVRYYYYE